MKELVNVVTQKTGLSESQAEQAVSVVVDFLKDKLPAPIASQLDNLLDASGDSDSVNDIAQSLGGLFGK